MSTAGNPCRPHSTHHWLATVARGALLLIASLTGTATAAGIPVKTLAGVESTFAEQIQPGHWTVVMMWTTYCGICRKQYPLLSAFHNAHEARDAQVLGVSLDGMEALDEVRAYVAKKPFSYPTVVANAEVIGRMFQTATGEEFTGTPTYLVFNPKRQLVAFKSGVIAANTLENYVKGQP